jgi:hypothetical protein
MDTGEQISSRFNPMEKNVTADLLGNVPFLYSCDETKMKKKRKSFPDQSNLSKKRKHTG